MYTQQYSTSTSNTKHHCADTSPQHHLVFGLAKHHVASCLKKKDYCLDHPLLNRVLLRTCASMVDAFESARGRSSASSGFGEATACAMAIVNHRLSSSIIVRLENTYGGCIDWIPEEHQGREGNPMRRETEKQREEEVLVFVYDIAIPLGYSEISLF